jgi:predicted transcriptional regulator
LTDATLTELTADIVSNYLAQNKIATDQLPELIRTTYFALADVATGGTAAAAPVKLIPAVSIKKSVTPDFLISLEDGRQYKSLKRHLRMTYNLTPDDYRMKWGLPKDYPMVAPSYAASRSAIAKQIGFGRGGGRRKATPARG